MGSTVQPQIYKQTQQEALANTANRQKISSMTISPTDISTIGVTKNYGNNGVASQLRVINWS